MENNGGFHGYQRPPHPQPPSGDNECLVREQDRLMPIANVIRIMRKTLPTHAKISDDAKETIQECVSEYISFVTGEANDRCQREQRKTVTAEDILWAMSSLGFDNYIEPLTLYLHRYREIDGGERGPTPAIKDDQPHKPFGIDDAFYQMGQHIFGPTSSIAAGLLKDSSNAGPSRAVAGFEPYGKCKE